MEKCQNKVVPVSFVSKARRHFLDGKMILSKSSFVILNNRNVDFGTKSSYQRCTHPFEFRSQ